MRRTDPGPVPRVLYICGWGRSGTTVIDRVLGEVPGFVSIGELRSLWDTDPADHLCGCGEPVSECPLWARVFDEVIEKHKGYTIRTIRSMRDETARTRHLFGLWRQANRSRSGDDRPFGVTSYGDVLEAVYRSVLAATGSGVVVDSSKHPAEALLLASRHNVDLTVLHVVRDPRAVAYSWSDAERHRQASDRPPPAGPISTSSWWTLWNAAAEVLIRSRLGSRYVSLRYEDVMAAPRQLLAPVVQQLGASASNLPLVERDRAVVLSRSHTVAGNPNRRTAGLVHLVPDRRWESEMRRGDRWLATVPAVPLLHHFGYCWRPRRAPRKLELRTP